jgi:hypothetical protein
LSAVTSVDWSGGEHLRRSVKFAVDSLLEGDGFELPVPRHKSREFSQHSGRRLLF